MNTSEILPQKRDVDFLNDTQRRYYYPSNEAWGEISAFLFFPRSVTYRRGALKRMRQVISLAWLPRTRLALAKKFTLLQAMQSKVE